MSAVMEEPRIRTAPTNLLWPGQRNVAVVFNIAYEAWSPGQSSGVGPMGNPYRRACSTQMPTATAATARMRAFTA
ncbi:hypothetical protein [Fodinicurvata halophila]|uniref:hypothetical protein n=1 Tax=Fodinicurvata halophila TaxID=1419723 RepID=UPI003640D237